MPSDHPYKAFRFQVEIEGILKAGMTDISGLKIETAVKPMPEGGMNNGMHQIIEGTSYSDITMKRGLCSLDLYAWYFAVTQGKVLRLNVTIFLLGDTGEPVMLWNLFDAFPKTWEGPVFSASSSQVATETITLAHEGMVALPV